MSIYIFFISVTSDISARADLLLTLILAGEVLSGVVWHGVAPVVAGQDHLKSTHWVVVHCGGLRSEEFLTRKGSSLLGNHLLTLFLVPLTCDPNVS